LVLIEYLQMTAGPVDAESNSRRRSTGKERKREHLPRSRLPCPSPFHPPHGVSMGKPPFGSHPRASKAAFRQSRRSLCRETESSGSSSFCREPSPLRSRPDCSAEAKRACTWEESSWRVTAGISRMPRSSSIPRPPPTPSESPNYTIWTGNKLHFIPLGDAADYASPTT